MDGRDAPSTPEWRPTSSLSGGYPSMATSSILLPPQASPFGDHSSTSSGDYGGMATLTQSQMTLGGRNIAPWEPATCERMTEQIRDIARPGPAPPPSITAGPRTLEEALRDAAVTIRFNAKWFAEAPLTILITTALDAASSSSSSADLNVAVGLIEIIATYSLIPPQALLHTIKFLSHAYYNASRAHKTKKLLDYVWKVLYQLLESHLGGQCVAALMEIVDCRDDVYLDSRAGHAVVAGALMIISEKMLLKTDVNGTIPTLDLPQLLDSLWGTAFYGNDNLRELIMEIVVRVLEDDSAVQEIDAQASWEALLETVEPCVAMTPHCKAAVALADCLTKHTAHFEARDLPKIAALLVDVDCPLTENLSDALLDSWSKLNAAGDWPHGLKDMMKKLAASTHYNKELKVLIDRNVRMFELKEEWLALPDFASDIESYVSSIGTQRQSTAELAKGIIQLFIQSTRPHSSMIEATRNELFRGVCGLAPQSMDAMQFLFQVRADVEGNAYLQSLDPYASPIDDPHPRYISHPIPGVSLEPWQETMWYMLKKVPEDEDYEVYRYFLEQLPSSLANHTMFQGCEENIIPRIGKLVSDQLDASSYPDPPPDSAWSKSQVIVRLVRILIAVLSYHGHLTKQSKKSLASTILGVTGSRDYTVSIPCIHALTICCYEIPDIMTSYMDDIIEKMSRMVTLRYLAIHVLVFLAGLSRLPQLFNNFQTHDYKKIFGVCGSYLQSIRSSNLQLERQQTPSSDMSGKTGGDTVDALPQYVYALAHHVIAFWYLALRPSHRAGLKDFIIDFLVYTSQNGGEMIEDQGLVTLDFMDRIDAEGNAASQELGFDTTDGRTVTRQRIAGLLLITTETALRTGKSIVTVRRPTGTTEHAIPGDDESMRLAVTKDTTDSDWINVFGEDLWDASYGRIYVPQVTSPLGTYTISTLPENDDAVRRAIQSFDRISPLDSHKAGVIYVGEDQTSEEEIFHNVQGSSDYINFIHALGSLRRLRDAKFNTQGLDRIDDADGQHAIVWNNDVTELVFHITTLMPNNDDSQLNTANKKRHIGNDFVNIIFNNSGRVFSADTFPSAFSAVYIVITPSARASFLQTRLASSKDDDQERFYRVHVLTRPGYPMISSAAEEKVISGSSLPGYVRNLALNECVFSLMWHQSGDYASSWRARLDQIRMMRDRFCS